MSSVAEIIAALRASASFSACSDKVLLTLARGARLRHHERDELVITAGALQREVLLLVEGSLHLFRSNRIEGTQILVLVLEPPAVFGDAELFSNGTWMVSARAPEPSVVLAIDPKVFNAVLELDGPLAARLYRDACARQMLLIEIMQVLSLQRTEHVIMRLLGDRARESNSTTFSASHAEIARSIGSNPRTVSRHLNTLASAGLLKRLRGGRVRILRAEPFLAWRALFGGPGARWRLPRGLADR